MISENRTNIAGLTNILLQNIKLAITLTSFAYIFFAFFYITGRGSQHYMEIHFHSKLSFRKKENNEKTKIEKRN